MKVGDSLIFFDISYNKTRGKISQGIIEKIGRTYFYFRVDYDLIKVEIGDFPIVVQEYNAVLFDSQESYSNYIQHKDNLKKLQVATRKLDLLTPDQIRRILEIIEE
jgi:hypothetical protein